MGLINKENYLVFQPMLPEVISGSIGILDAIAPIRRLCPKTNLYTREVVDQPGNPNRDHEHRCSAAALPA